MVRGKGKEVTLPAHGWTPRGYQMDAWRALRNPDVDEVCLAWARRHGKDELALHAMMVKMMERPGNYYHMLPQYNQARRALWEAVNPHTGRVRWKDAFPEELIDKVDNQSMSIRFKNGSTWQLLGSDNPDSLVGTPPVGVVFSEAALSNPMAFALFEPIRMENKGFALYVSSTRGRNHFHDTFQRVSNKPTGYASHISALDTNVFDDEQLAEALRSNVALFGDAVGRSLFEQEYLSSWDAAVIGAVFGAELSGLKQDGRALPLVYDPRYPVDTSWDIGVADETVVLFWQNVGNTPRLIDWYSSTDNGVGHFADVLRSKRYVYGTHYGPHDLHQREWGSNAATRISTAAQFGLHFKHTPSIAKDLSIGLAASLIDRMEINIGDEPSKDCSFVLNALDEYKYKYNKERRTMSSTPVHN